MSRRTLSQTEAFAIGSAMHVGKRRRSRRLAPWEIAIRVAGIIVIPAAGIGLGLFTAWMNRGFK